MRPYVRRVVFGVAVAVVACAVYWLYMVQSHQRQVQYAEDQLQSRAMRLAEAMSIQVETLFAGLEYLSGSLADSYLADPQHYFRDTVAHALRVFPENSITQVAVADANGTVVYSNLTDGQQGPQPATQVSIADREHFLVHTQPQAGRKAFISKPIFGRVSQRWTVQLSYPLYQDQTFAGVVVLSVPVEYISGYFRQVFASADDVAVLLYADGEYVARSAIESEVMGQKVPSDRPYLTNTSLNAGLYEAVEKVDGAPRLYAWHRVVWLIIFCWSALA